MLTPESKIAKLLKNGHNQLNSATRTSIHEDMHTINFLWFYHLEYKLLSVGRQ
jgi:hypothetical protein